jgi:glutamine synthetase
MFVHCTLAYMLAWSHQSVPSTPTRTHSLTHPHTASARRTSTNCLPLRSSTNQAPGENSEVLIYPQAVFKDPFRPGDGHILVMCDCYTPAGEPLPSNTRFRCNEVMEKCMAKGEEPWFGIEQEYVALSFPFLSLVFSFRHLHVSHCCVRDNHQHSNCGQLGDRTARFSQSCGESSNADWHTRARANLCYCFIFSFFFSDCDWKRYTLFEPDFRTPLGWPPNGFPAPQGPYYCGMGANTSYGRYIVEAHYRACLYAGIQISGVNAEVRVNSWCSCLVVIRVVFIVVVLSVLV